MPIPLQFQINGPVIGLDYDGTCTLNEKAWIKVVQALKAGGMHVFIITMRYPQEQHRMAGKHPMNQDLVDACDGVIFTSRKGKKTFVKELGLPITVWIDDTPEALFLNADEVWGRQTKLGDIVVTNDPSTHPSDTVADLAGSWRTLEQLKTQQAETLKKLGIG